MAIEHDIMRHRLLIKAGLVEIPKPRYTLKELERRQWSDQFEIYMRNRLLMGGMRYGLMGEKESLNTTPSQAPANVWTCMKKLETQNTWWMPPIYAWWSSWKASTQTSISAQQMM